MSASEMSLYEVIESLPPKHGARAEFSALLSRRRPPCVCGEPTLGVVHRADGPCYLPEQAPPAAAVPEPMPPVPDSMGLSREQREVEDAWRRGWNSCRALVMQLNAYALAVRNKENNND